MRRVRKFPGTRRRASIGAEKITVSGDPDEDRIWTSHVERANWTLRGHLRRMTRLSNGFSRKRANLRAALALFFAYYNFCKFHKTIRMTPAMKAGIARKPWSMAGLLAAAQATTTAAEGARYCDSIQGWPSLPTTLALGKLFALRATLVIYEDGTSLN